MAVPPRIGNVTAGLMVGFSIIMQGIAGLLTATGLLIPLAMGVGLFEGLVIGFWFMLLHAYSGAGAHKKVGATIGAALVDFMPLLGGLLPASTLGVIVNIYMTRKEDREKSLAPTAVPKRAQAAARLERMKASRAGRTNAGRESREEMQQARHTPANDNDFPNQAREAA